MASFIENLFGKIQKWPESADRFDLLIQAPSGYVFAVPYRDGLVEDGKEINTDSLVHEAKPISNGGRALYVPVGDDRATAFVSYDGFIEFNKSNPLNNISDEQKKSINKIKLLVEATPFERDVLFESKGFPAGKTFKTGFMIGLSDETYVEISIREVDGVTIGFYEGCSVKVNHAVIQDFTDYLKCTNKNMSVRGIGELYYAQVYHNDFKKVFDR